MTTCAPYSVPVPASDTPGQTLVHRSVIAPHELVHQPHPRVATLHDLLHHAAARFGSKHLFGHRPLVGMIEEEKTLVRNGKEEKRVWKYYHLGAYEWVSYSEVLARVVHLGAGLRHLGLQPIKDKMVIFAATSPDWIQVAHACFSQRMTIATAYDTLGPPGLLHALNECCAPALFTNADLVPVVAKVAAQATHLRFVFYNGARRSADDPCLAGIPDSVKFIHISDLEAMGSSYPCKPTPPTPSDIACIMYTSGSTGNPKGVLLSHRNLVAAVAGIDRMLEFHVNDSDVLIAYLPLAHVLEFVIEHTCMWIGIQLGYGSVRTLTDAAVRSCKGDLRELRPTLLAGVPAVWDQIRRGAVAKIDDAGPMARLVFNTALSIKWQAYQWGLPTGWIDPVFGKLREATGGRLRFALSGGAPISAESQRFLTAALCPILQGYGLTESCGMCTLLIPEMFQLQRTGACVPCVEIKLVDVPDAGYRTTDKPDPRGEVWIRGPSITAGYFKRADITAETFTDDGWFMTGDIGVLHHDGTLSIVDRKKNLVKLSHGEYIALEKMEAVYKASNSVVNMCVVADPLHAKAVALVQPVEARVMKTIVPSLGLPATMSFHEACMHPKVRRAVLDDVLQTGRAGGLTGAELIASVWLCDEEWTSVNGMLTAAQKIKRKDIQEAFKDGVKTMYSELSK